MRRDILVAQADACRVSIEWLAAGRGNKHAEWYTPDPPPADGNVAVGKPIPFSKEVVTGHGIGEHPVPLQALMPIDEDHLTKAIELIKMLDNTEAFDDDKHAAAHLANIYAVLAGLKP